MRRHSLLVPLLAVLAVLGGAAVAGRPALFAATQDRGRGAGPAAQRGRGDGAGRRDAEGARDQAPAPDHDALVEKYFAAADDDHDGWISFREARRALLVDRPGFFRFDTDRDGLVGPAEFEERYHKVIARGGTFRAPIPKGDASRPSAADPVTLRDKYDANRDGSLSEPEITRLMEDLGHGEIDGETVLEKLDGDHSDALELEEILQLVRLMPAAERPVALEPTPEVTAGSIVELFGQAESRDDQPATTPLPPRIRGPVPHFRRLDLDGDGFISTKDLERLQRPLHLPVRVNTVVSYLDTDGDGELSPAELRSSMVDQD